MPHNRVPQKGSKWYLPPYRYKTVVNFCLDYKRMKKEYAELVVLTGVSYDGMPKGNYPGSPTERIASRAYGLSYNINTIEQCVRDATHDYPALYEWVLHGVTDDRATYESLRADGMPLSHTAFSDRRRRVYYILSEKI